jgi:hypothetical protein
MDLAAGGTSVTISGSLSISVEGEDRCGARIFGGGSFSSMVAPRILFLPEQGIVRYSVDSQCGSHNITGVIGCTNKQCVDDRDCTAAGGSFCNDPIIRQRITSALPWFADTAQVTTVPGLECSGVSYSYPPPTCEFSNPALNSSHPTAVPGQLAVFPGRATLETTGGGNPCSVSAAITLSVTNYRSATECQSFNTVWYNVLQVCNLNGVIGSYRKLCRFPGDTILGTYVRDGGDDTEVCYHEAVDANGEFLYWIQVQRTYGQTLTVS